MTLDEKALQQAAEALAHVHDFGAQSTIQTARVVVGSYLAALRPGSTREAEEHGPYGYLVCPIGLDESHWWLSDNPVKDEGSFCLPMFTKEDPFERAMLAAAGGRAND